MLADKREREARGNRELAKLLTRHQRNVDHIVRIQRAWRDYKSRMDFRTVLMQNENGCGPVSVAQVSLVVARCMVQPNHQYYCPEKTRSENTSIWLT